METDNTYAGNRIAALRKKRGLTQARLAESSGISIRTIQRIEANEVSPYDDTLVKIASALSVEISDLQKPAVPFKKLILIHLSPLTGFAIPLFQLIAPYFLWLFYRKEYKALDLHIKDIIVFHLLTTLLFGLGLVLVNFNYTFGYYLAIGTMLCCTTITLWNAHRLSESKQYLYLNVLYKAK